MTGIDVGYKRQIYAYDRLLELETYSLRPLVFHINNLLNKDEYDYIITTAKPKMEKSKVSFMDKDKGKEDKEFRTSSTYFMPSTADKYLPLIDERIANLTRLL